ncbi:hypothetical protein ONS95_013984 [Cadophora gregata]|uniref:uncharacterized protein n=1 Tax=Cadophora gregata TaxID=51156 RepID=UPI0026DB8799|nr:uncharacterized protein ONS95_013984 [Cadophora gregata]KAK0113735.1 hypothetical protein ONS96_014591 [Cadophora gregata f. sp. sojae]KAK0114492.1 hypothetical protein ONS95_013984 [Cadophora gregata]
MLATSEGPRPGSPYRQHPRRPPPHLSVSLRHDGLIPVEKAEEVQVGTKGRPVLGTSMRQPSDESYDSGESGGRWFDQANKHPGKGLGFPGVEDDEPPYFLPRNTSTHSIDAQMDRSKLHPSHVTSQPQRLQYSVNGGSSVGDYRSVIDDLTIENQKLKQELRKLKKPNDTPHLEKDKLFEVRIHGKLSDRKRRELEDVLGSFASSIDDPTEKTSSQSKQTKATHSYSSLGNPKKSAAKNSSSSNTSTSRLPDSAYASMSNSGPTSLFTPTNRHGVEDRKASQPPVRSDQNIHSFLHNIPEGLLPKHSPVMTERQKKKFVVQRLEQLFTGRKGVVGGDHSQPLQQQEVSASAAKADQAANHGVAPLEGLREAHMLPHVMDLDKNKSRYSANHAGNEQFPEPYISDASDEASPSDSPGQRPTRPLDLDPDRAQVPSDNVDYIRHLGLSTPKFSSETSSDSTTAADAEGWIYLNLLVNMAQLHIVNVTPDFVREALSDVSERFQVSRDGKKVRWRGGTQATRMSSDDGASTAPNRTPEDSDSLDEPNRKRRKVDARKFAPVPVNAPDAEPMKDKPLQSFHYKPLFHHSESSGGFISSDESESLFGYNARTEALHDSTSADPQMWRKGPNQRSAKEKQDAGLLVYYNGARFCTDLSGDRIRASTPLHNSAVDQDGYYDGQQGALGGAARKEAPMFERSPSGSLLPYRPFKDYSKGVSIPGLDDPRPTTPDLLSDGPDDDFFASVSACGISPPTQQQAFESTGLGGTRPADHFIMKVQTRRTMTENRQSSKVSRFTTSGSGQKRFAHNIPRSSLKFFLEQGIEATKTRTTSMTGTAGASTDTFPVKSEIISSHLKHLEPSELPPPLGYHTAYSSSDDDSDSSESSSQSSHRQRKPRQPQVSITSPNEHPSWAHRYPDGGLSDGGLSDGDESDDSEEDDDGSIDMLAEARKLDPETVAAKEKEFEMAIDDKGTDAATVNESVSPGFRGLRGVLRRSTTSDVPTSAIVEEDD